VSDLSSWCLRHYEALHDFAGPTATFFAGGIAIFVTWTLGRRQVEIARRQAEIAAQQADTARYRLRTIFSGSDMSSIKRPATSSMS
jgi:hypothetical protein